MTSDYMSVSNLSCLFLHKKSQKETRRSVEHSTPHADGAPLHFTA